MTPSEQRPAADANGLIFSGLAGVAGAVGAICVIFATKSAFAAAAAANLPKDSYKLYIAPLIFGLAPVINTLVSVIWHPQKGQPFHFDFVMPGWKLWAGILLVAVGAALVLFSKEESESGKAAAPSPATSAPTANAALPLEKES